MLPFNEAQKVDREMLDQLEATLHVIRMEQGSDPVEAAFVCRVGQCPSAKVKLTNLKTVWFTQQLGDGVAFITANIHTPGSGTRSESYHTVGSTEIASGTPTLKMWALTLVERLQQ